MLRKLIVFSIFAKWRFDTLMKCLDDDCKQRPTITNLKTLLRQVGYADISYSHPDFYLVAVHLPINVAKYLSKINNTFGSLLSWANVNKFMYSCKYLDLFVDSVFECNGFYLKMTGRFKTYCKWHLFDIFKPT